ncbi:MAG TPA: NAD(+)/NADH kinase [Acidobacteriota bacterium]
MRKIKRVGVVIKPHAPRIREILRDLVRYFEKKGIAGFLEEPAAEKLGRSGGLRREDLPGQVDLVVVLGGDGTFLSVAHLAAEQGVPVMGVNLGSLGFLTEVPLSEMTLTLDALLAGNEEIVSARWLLETTCSEKSFLCLNDAVINKGALARMIQMKIWVDGLDVAILKADGLIISTPTGSTAYSLSAGGPILQPRIPAIIITPICPHTLTFRPMAVASDSVVKVRLLAADEEVFLSLDGQRGMTLRKNGEFEVRRASRELQLISSPQRNYFNLLKEKLGWGE